MITDQAEAIAAHKRLAKVLPRRINVMPGSSADGDDEVRTLAKREPGLTLAGYRSGDMLKVIAGRFVGEVVTFDKCAGAKNGVRVLRIKRATGGAVVLANQVEPA